MARLADRRIAAAMLAVGAGPLLLLGGCDSTIQANARAKLAAQRRLAAKEAHLVVQRGTAVRVDRVTLLRDADSTAVVVDLHNATTQAVGDVPISVGVRRGTAKVLLNDDPELDWFQTHLPLVAGGDRATWVFRSPPGGRARAGDTPFVRIGAPLRTVATSPLPTLTATVAHSTASKADVVLSDATVPQIGLPVNVVARRDEVPVAAGTAVLDTLDRDEQRTISVPLTRDARTLAPTASALPTIYQ
ncbi:MAG: hypothetical protein QM679_01825 [Patulibacter sp.]